MNNNKTAAPETTVRQVKKMRKPLASAFVVGVASLGCSVRSWSFDKKKHNGVVVKKNSNTDDDKLLFSPLSAATEADDDTTTTTTSRRRRQMMKKCGGAVITGLFGGGGGGIFFAHPDSANAMCLQGDERPECIGVYKVPPDETVLKYAENPRSRRSRPTTTTTTEDAGFVRIRHRNPESSIDGRR